jgi:hypothetical protein
MRRCLLVFLCNLQKKALDLRLVFNETSFMGCTLGPIRDPRAEDHKVPEVLIFSAYSVEFVTCFEGTLCKLTHDILPNNLKYRVFISKFSQNFLNKSNQKT